jgi:Ca2+-binding EF-hand superfamily protein
MKTNHWMILGLLISASSFVCAQDPSKHRQERKIPAEILEKFDKDGDGKISREERKAMDEERKKEMLAKFDKDSDGKLSDEERAEMRAEMESRHKELLEKYDADKDGKLGPEEIKTAREAGEKIPPGRGPWRKGDKQRRGDLPSGPPAE